MDKYLKIIKVKENKAYCFDELLKKYNDSFNNADLTDKVKQNNYNKLTEALKVLQKAKIVRLCSKDINQIESNDTIEDIIEAVHSNVNNIKYAFAYVGLVENNGLLFEAYPKYVEDETNADEELALALRCISKYNSKSIKKTFLENSYSQDNNRPASLLDTMIYIMSDYYENGLYTNEQELIEIDGDGPIFWDKTIDEIDPFIQDDIPIYMHTFNQRNRLNENDLFTRLHKCILTECSNTFEKARLFDFITSIVQIDLSNESLEDFGDLDYLKTRILQEKNVQFNTRKQFLLDLMYNYIDGKFHLQSDENMVVYGTKNMNIIWEDACRVAFDDSLDKPIYKLGLKLYNDKSPVDYTHKNLRDLIQKPVWTINDDEKYEASTLIPDLIHVSPKSFNIYDAKYYIISCKNGAINGQPGIDSIIKQYMYEISYKQFLYDFGFLKSNTKKTRMNVFIVPADENGSNELKGTVEFSPINSLKIVGFKLNTIRILHLNPKDLFTRYLSNNSYSDQDLKTLDLM